MKLLSTIRIILASGVVAKGSKFCLTKQQQNGSYTQLESCWIFGFSSSRVWIRIKILRNVPKNLEHGFVNATWNFYIRV